MTVLIFLVILVILYAPFLPVDKPNPDKPITKLRRVK